MDSKDFARFPSCGKVARRETAVACLAQTSRTSTRRSRRGHWTAAGCLESIRPRLSSVIQETGQGSHVRQLVRPLAWFPELAFQ